MSNYKDCSLVQDLLQLYKDDLLSQKSIDYVEKHLSECDKCRNALEELEQTRLLESEKEKTNDKLLKRALRKWKYELIGFVLGIIIVVIAIISLMFVPTIINITGHVNVTADSPADYGKQKFKGFSELLLFPENGEINGEITDYYYHCEGERIYQNYQIYLEVQYDANAYEEEKDRLNSIYNDKTMRNSKYTEDEFILPAVYTMLYADAYEYALLDDENRSVMYIYLQGINRNEIMFDKDYLPKSYGRSGNSYETERKPYSIYPEW